ncbi:hypothetical protein L195_g034582 [Trifolium pratense]|uniref:DUF4219 domain-containing protein n=1 Tax=Trifolium pratense TaxID=57577 RepID=A0A2K3LJ78_TRIPR|nr:hypothetical protein L195_g034582 [Trifolium pratense]
MTSHPNGHFLANLPILNGKNYDNWCKQMKVVFCYQDLWSLVTEGITPIGARATDEEKTSHKELKKKISKKGDGQSVEQFVHRRGVVPAGALMLKSAMSTRDTREKRGRVKNRISGSPV